MVAAAATPWICGRFGWKAAPRIFGVVIAAVTACWHVLGAEQPADLLPKAAPTAGLEEPDASDEPVEPRSPYDPRIVLVAPAKVRRRCTLPQPLLTGGGGHGIRR